MRSILFIILLLINSIYSANAKDIDVKFDVNEVLNCEFQKLLAKNPKSNFETFLPGEVDNNNIENLKITANIPSELTVEGLSKFLNNFKNYEVKVVNKDIILFKAFNEERNYSESSIIDRKTGELVHEITKNIKTDNVEKEISFYNCSKAKVNI
ncbi:MAG: hypothetical protein VW545_02965 [Pelagibacteraceae bacterium]